MKQKIMLILLAVSLMAGSAMAAEIDVFGYTWTSRDSAATYTVNSPTSLTVAPNDDRADLWFCNNYGYNSGLSVSVGDVLSYDRYATPGYTSNPGFSSQPLSDAGVSLDAAFEYCYGVDNEVHNMWQHTSAAGWLDLGDHQPDPDSSQTGMHFEFTFDTATTVSVVITDILTDTVLQSGTGSSGMTLGDVGGWYLTCYYTDATVTYENFVVTGTGSPQITLSSVLTTMSLLPADLAAVVVDGDNDVSSVSWEVLADDGDYPAGAIASVTDTPGDLYAPAATFTTDTEGTYKVRLTVNDLGGSSVESIAQIDVYGDACQAAQIAANWAVFSVYDADTDCDVDLFDFAQFALKWLDDINLAAQETYAGVPVYIPKVNDMPNGSFETGDFTHWRDNEPRSITDVGADVKEGSYACTFDANGAGEGEGVYGGVTTKDTDFFVPLGNHTISWWYKGNLSAIAAAFWVHGNVTAVTSIDNSGAGETEAEYAIGGVVEYTQYSIDFTVTTAGTGAFYIWARNNAAGTGFVDDFQLELNSH